MALTDTAIRGTKPGQKPFRVYDRDGLFLLVNPGGSKLWRWRYRFDGKEKLMALGEYPLVNLSQARELHFSARKTLATGDDPMAERKAEADAKQREAKARQREAENSFENVARKWCKWWSIGKSPRHADTVRRRLVTSSLTALRLPTFGKSCLQSRDAMREMLLSVRMRPHRRSFGMRLLVMSQVEILLRISSLGTFWPKPGQRTAPAWMSKSCRNCWRRWTTTTETRSRALP
jgi:Arm DNA-binding domain